VRSEDGLCVGLWAGCGVRCVWGLCVVQTIVRTMNLRRYSGTLRTRRASREFLDQAMMGAPPRPRPPPPRPRRRGRRGLPRGSSRGPPSRTWRAPGSGRRWRASLCSCGAEHALGRHRHARRAHGPGTPAPLRSPLGTGCRGTVGSILPVDATLMSEHTMYPATVLRGVQ